MNEGLRPRPNRRAFCVRSLRAAAFALLGAAGGAIFLKRRRLLREGKCVNDGVCRGCGVFDECGLPLALSAKSALRRRSNERQ
jgi:hypothetical protein